MSESLSFTFGPHGANLCGNCKERKEVHVANKCPFFPTTYRPITDVELVTLIEKLEVPELATLIEKLEVP